MENIKSLYHFNSSFSHLPSSLYFVDCYPDCYPVNLGNIQANRLACPVALKCCLELARHSVAELICGPKLDVAASRQAGSKHRDTIVAAKHPEKAELLQLDLRLITDKYVLSARVTLDGLIEVAVEL